MFVQHREQEFLPLISAFIERHPGDVSALQIRANTYISLQRNAEALADGKQACSLGDPFSCTWVERAEATMKR
jgi:hypothetical protein